MTQVKEQDYEKKKQDYIFLKLQRTGSWRAFKYKVSSLTLELKIKTLHDDFSEFSTYPEKVIGYERWHFLEKLEKRILKNG